MTEPRPPYEPPGPPVDPAPPKPNPYYPGSSYPEAGSPGSGQAAYAYRPPPSKTQAGWALGLALSGLCCLLAPLVAVPLAISVLNRSRAEGVDHGKGLAVAALAVSSVVVGVLASTLFAGLLLGGFSDDDPSLAKEAVNADPRVVTEPSSLEAGDCLTVPSLRDGTEGYDRRVPCSRPHDGEVHLVFTLAGERFPGERAVDRRARRCSGKAFQRYVGTPYGASRLESHYYYPTKQTWSYGDRTIVCFIVDPRGPTKGSVKGTKPRHDAPSTSTDTA